MEIKGEEVMLSIEDTLRIRLSLQKAIAELGQEALSGIPLKQLYKSAAKQLQKILNVEYVKIAELLPQEKKLVIRSGVGWKKSVHYNKTKESAGKHSQAGYALQRHEPVIVTDLRTERRFSSSKLMLSHHVISGMSVILYKANKKPYGVLGVHTSRKREFSQDDLDYLQSVANIISLAIQRYEIEEDLNESQQAFKALYDSNIMGVIFINLEGGITAANDAFLELIEYTREDLEENRIDWQSLTPDEYKPQDVKAGEKFIKTGYAPPYEKEVITKHGERKTVIVGGVMINKETTESAAFAIDITERKKAEQRKDEFVGIASHELRTPLTSIKGYLQILERHIKSRKDEQMMNYIQKANLHVEKMNRLIGDLLDVSRIQSGRLELNIEKFDFIEMVDEAIDIVQPTSSHHKIVLTSDGSITLVGDKNRLEQAIINLLSNAIKYSPKAHRVDVKVSKTDRKVEFQVTDYGIGIPKRKQKRIFERFYRVSNTAREYSGMGIGLYVSSEIIKRHKGKIRVKSNVGEGSTFHFSLPITKHNE